ncbi:loganic acid O-methyltransferase-like [Malania oleifera]|uniref:loganic acid O-methyltransferase-like n=1 Tax=Malania oleifera TaxID=397392 RepID=UPI0025AE1238|nr:loganic acid O-methyltransferase-like [Malania oleifera]
MRAKLGPIGVVFREGRVIGKRTESWFAMNGGEGVYSYTKNSSFQREAASIVQEMIDEEIANKLDVKTLISSTSNTFRLVDMGCSVGPNTFIAVQNVIDAMKKKYQSQCQSHGTISQMLDFQVFFNDQASNDFNLLFASLPPERPYFAAGVPGSFHRRLFPSSSLHFAYSSIAIHWLSRVPKQVLDKNCPAWNKGRIHYTNAPREVVNAYEAQFAADMDAFFNARAKELLVGGMMVLIVSTVQDGMPQKAFNGRCEVLGSCLVDMANVGLITEDQVDAFNLPMYSPSPIEMTKAIERNGCFSIERMVLNKPTSWIKNPFAMQMHFRAGTEGLIAKHFGTKIIDELFDRFLKKIKEFYDNLESNYEQGGLLFVSLKRKK